MKKLLASLQAALDKLESFGERRRALEDEQRELPAKIQALTVAVGGGEAKSVNALTIAKARLKLLPGELAAVKDEYEAIIGELTNLVCEISPALGVLWNAAHERVDKTAREFLEKILDNGYQVNEITRQIVANSTELRELEKYRFVYSGLYSFSRNDPQLTVSRAEYAVKNLKQYQ